MTLGSVPIAMTTGVLIQVSTVGLDHGRIILAERRAMGCDRAAVTQAGHPYLPLRIERLVGSES